MNREKDTGVAASRGWLTIDTAPRDGSHVLLYSGMFWPTGEVGLIPNISVGSYRKRLSEHVPAWRPIATGPYDNERLTPTHWMPLPEAPKALTVNTSTPGNDLEYNGLAATRDLERRVQKLEWYVSTLIEEKKSD